MVYICILLSEIPTQFPWFVILRKSMMNAKEAEMEPSVIKKEKSLSLMK